MSFPSFVWLFFVWGQKMSKECFYLSFAKVWNQLLLEGVMVLFIGKWYFETKIWSSAVLRQWSPLREGNGTPLQYSCLENPMDGGTWWAAVHGVAKSQTRMSDFTFTFHFHALEKEMATHSSVLAWRIPGTGEPGGLLSMGSHRVEHNWSDLAAVLIELDCCGKKY